MSSIGFGTHLGEADLAVDSMYREAIVAAVRGGINLIDSATNYRLGRSERAIGDALRNLKIMGICRNELVLASKAGYIPSSEPREYFLREIVHRGLANPTDLMDGSHCLAPGFLRHQLNASLERLGVEAIDIYYLHNPEEQTRYLQEKQFLERMSAAFETLEEAVSLGQVSYYGIATWDGCRIRAGAPAALSLPTLVQLAEKIAGPEHHFRVVQVPFNAAMTEIVTVANQPTNDGLKSVLNICTDLGLTLVTSAPLLQGRLARRLPAAIRDATGSLVTVAQKALQFARSTPGVTSTLVGMRNMRHVSENLELVLVSPLEPETMQGLLPALRDF